MNVRNILLPVGVLLAGFAAGGGAAIVAARVAGPPKPSAAPVAEDERTGFVPVTRIIAPLVMSDGRLSGYVAFDIQLQVPADKVEFVTVRVPLLLDAINMRTYRTPMAAGPDGMLPDVATFRDIVNAVLPGAIGPHLVRKVAVTQALPA